MDKYTVDLDKVLNDFEYSELTDNFSTNKAYHAQGSSSYASSSKSKTGDAKHSITNVFHSLNEYLNTDISNITKIKLDNKENNYTVSSKNFLQTTKDKNTTDTSVSVDNNLKRLELNVPVDEVKNDSFCSKLANENSINADTLLDLTSGEALLNDNKNVKQIINEKSVINNVENLLDLDDLNVSSERNIERLEDLSIISADTLLPCTNADADKYLVPQQPINDNKTINDNVNIDRTEIIEKVSEHATCCNSIEINANKNITQKIEENLNPPNAEVEKNSVDDKKIEETENKNVPNIVSFENDLDIDDSALNQYLDELEHEYRDESLEEDEGISKDIEEPHIPVDIHPIVIEGAVKETIENNLEGNSSKEILNNNEKVHLEVIQESEISESVLPNKDDTDVDISDEFDQKDTESVSSVERPKLLELNPSALTETREINLIGNPGSTPYNNVYISKELQTTSVQKESSSQDESETSPSVSPTFSEASTEILTDSTDTESKDDEQDADLDTEKLETIAKDDQNETTPVNDTFSAAEFAPISAATSLNASTIEMDDAIGGEATVLPIESDSNAVLSGEGNPSNIVGLWLGKEAPLWIPDSDALSCLHCDARFTVIKRRHHCRACGLVLCSKCCNLRYRLEYMDAEARVCAKCYAILNMDTNSSSGSEVSQTNSPNRQPNPNNPMEYCSVVPPMQQVGAVAQNPPTVMVPVGVLKRKGSSKGKTNKSVMFCDGIRPGSDLAKLDTDFNYSSQNPGSSSSKKPVQTVSKVNRNLPTIDPQTKSFIPNDSDSLPPTITVFKSDITYIECMNGENIVETLKCEKLTFALQRNLHVHVKLINMDCCINKTAWCFSTEGLISVGQDEIVYIIELMEDEKALPVDVFHHINSIYNDAVKGTTVTEMGLSLHNNSNFLGFKNHAGFLYIRPTFQCLQNIIRPNEPYLIGLLIHRWETPWAKIFPLRLVLRLGAEYRYYPSPIISTRHRDSVFVEIGHTIINILADFRNFSYTLPTIRGLTIHMEDKNTTVTIPENRYDQVMKSLNNSSDHILAFSGNFSTKADSHLVCVQDTQASSENSYTTHAINILNKPRKVTGASFIVFNGALKSSSGLTAKSSIIEDGLMIQIPPENMTSLRDSLRNMKNYTIQCGCVNAPSDETVNIIWGEPDTNFNMGVTSPIDNDPLSGVPSIRVHNGKDFVCNSGNRLIRWTEVFILQNTDEHSKAKDPIDISKISESISKATCQALVKYLDLLTSNNFYKIGIRTTLHVENVSYSAGSNNVKLPPIYMKNLDNELIPVLHRISSNNLGDNAITLELIFRILNT